jgi:hypothetical protein
MTTKTLIIIANYKVIEKSTLSNYASNVNTIDYKTTLYGQSNEQPKAIFIKSLVITAKGYIDFIQQCEDIYCKYYNTDANNLIIIEELNKLK